MLVCNNFKVLFVRFVLLLSSFLKTIQLDDVATARCAILNANVLAAFLLVALHYGDGTIDFSDETLNCFTPGMLNFD